MQPCEFERRTRAVDKMLLRKHLPDLLVYVAGALGDKTRAQELVKASKNIADYVRRVAEAMVHSSGTESEVAVSILGMVSDIALNRTPPKELKKLNLDTPTTILRWFAAYLENTLDKKDLAWDSAVRL